MKNNYFKFSNFLICCLFSLTAYSQTTVTIFATGTPGSFNTGSVNAAGTKNDDNMVTINSASNRGWAKFDLSTIPSGAVVSAASVMYTTFTSVASGAINNIYGFTGNPAIIAGPTLYTNTASGTSFNASSWAANAANTKVLNAAGMTFLSSSAGSANVCLGFVRGSTNTYNIYGYSAIPANQPQLTITYTVPPACSGTPATGTTASTSNPVCPSASFTISVTGGTTGVSGLTYQWQSSPDGTTYSNIGGATGLTYVTTQTVATYYQLITTCTASGLSSTSTPIFITMNPFMNCYCSSMPTTTADEEITNVTVSTLNNSSTCATVAPGPGSIASRYGNYMSGAGAPAAPAVTQVTPESFSITVGSCGTFNYNSGLAIFIDLNQNGSFADAGEKVYSNGATANINCVPATVVTGTFTIPGSALLGNTVMRIVNAEGISGDAIVPCNTTFGFGEVEDYLINIVAASVCSGTPSPGNTTSTLGAVCSTTSFTLGMSTPPSGLTGISYQWQSSPDGVTWANISGATSSTYTTTQGVSTYYRVIVTCATSGLSGTSTPLQVTMNPFMSCYCSSMPTTTADEEITNVTVSTLNNSSTCATVGPGPGSIAGRYANYMSGAGAPAAPVLTQVTPESFSITVGSCGTFNYNSGLAIFIDLNQNGSFADAGEKVYSNGATAGIACVPATIVTGTFTIPVTALLGTTAMRIVNAEGISGNAIVPCNTAFGYGEVEDYLVNIIAATPCAGTPSPGNTTSTAGSVCSTTGFTLGMSTPPSGLTGISYQWQSSPDGVTWANIAGATSSTYTTTQGVSTYYQVIVTCASSGLSGTSTPLQVTMNPFMACYCTSMPTTTFDEEITNTTVGTLNNSSTCATVAPGPGSIAARYGNYMSGTGAPAAPNFFQLSSQSLAVTIGSCGSFNYTSGLAIFIDYNQNGSFADAGEKVFSNGAASDINCVPPTTVTGSFVVPGSATLGLTGMRVINAEFVSGDAITPCMTFGYGEVEDYLVNIQPPPPIDMTPVAVAFPTSASCHTASDSVVITIQNLGSAIMDYSVTPVTVNSSSTGTNPAIFTPVVLSTGTLAVGATQNVTVATGYNMSAAGNYTFNAYTMVTGDGNTANDTMAPVTVTVDGVTAMVDNDTICPGDSIQLDVITPALMPIGSGTLVNTTFSYPTPYGNYYDGARSQYLVLASELTAAGISAGPISALEFDVVSTNGIPHENFNISMMSTAVTSLTAFQPGSSSVFSSPAYTPVVGANVHTFSTPYVWDGTSNVIVELCFYNPAFTYTQNTIVNQSATSFESSLTNSQDNFAAICTDNTIGTNVFQRPNMRFTSAGPYTYSWTPVAGLNDPTLQNPAGVASTTTNYIVTVTNTGSGCTMTDTVNVFVHPPAMLTLNDTTVCSGGSYVLNAQNAGSTYLWNTLATTQSITITMGGLYYVDITTANGCTSRDSINITMNAQPNVDLGPDAGFCFGDSILLDAGNTGFNFLWNNGTTGQTLMASSTGAYYVTVTNPVTGCAATDTNNVTEYALPVIPLGADTALCFGDSLVLNAGTDGDVYAWGGGQTTQMITVSTAGTYSVTVTNTVTTCVNTESITIMINALPVVTLGADTAICNGSTLTLDAGYPGSMYMWSDASTAQTLGVTAAGTYSVAIVDTNGCMDSDTISVSINALPVVNLGADTIQCGGTVLLDAGMAVSYLWNDASTAQTLAAGVTGPYSVIVTDVNGCSGTDTINVTINALPAVNFGADTTQCGGGITLDAGNPGFTYLWNNSTTNQTLTVFITGTYSVMVMDTLTGCMDGDTINVTLNPLPLVDIGSDSTQCAGTIVLDAGNPGASYLWNTSVTTQTLTVNASGTYYVTVTNGSSCSASDSVNITINPLPVIVFAPFTSAVCLQAAPFTLTATPAGGTFFGTGVSAGMFDPATAGVGTHSVTYGVVDGNGCSNSVSQNINVQDCTGIEEMLSGYDVTVYPNPTTGAFSLTIANANLSELRISIVDIQGREVFTSMDKNVAGDFRKEISLENISKGIYYIRLSTGQDMKIKKLIVQ
ncbi:MAG: T9SS type A sorting domain-containing protein [Bacteroidota bacterium]|nr:T9SS type A sorting domain-containing protein [Bacteroidota bacterium]